MGTMATAEEDVVEWDIRTKGMEAIEVVEAAHRWGAGTTTDMVGTRATTCKEVTIMGTT